MRILQALVLAGIEPPANDNTTWGAVVPGEISGLTTAGNSYGHVVENLKLVTDMTTEADPLNLEQVLALSNVNNINHEDHEAPGFFYTFLILPVWVQDDVELSFEALAERDKYRDVVKELGESIQEHKFDLHNPAHPSEILIDYLHEDDDRITSVLSATQLEQIKEGTLYIDLELAQVLAQALETSVEYWLNLDHQYRMFHAKRIDNARSV